MDGRVSKLELELMEVQSRLLILENCFASLNGFQNKETNSTKGTEEGTANGQNDFNKAAVSEVWKDENISVKSIDGVESNQNQIIQEDFLEDVVYKMDIDAEEHPIDIDEIKVEFDNDYDELLGYKDNHNEDPLFSISDDRSQPPAESESAWKNRKNIDTPTTARRKFPHRRRVRSRKDYPPLTIPQLEDLPPPPHVSLTVLTPSELDKYRGRGNDKLQDLQQKLKSSVDIYSCYFCLFKTNSFKNLCGHISTHTKEGTMKINPGQTKQQGSILMQMHTFYKGTGERPYHCPHCSYTGQAEHNLYAHMRSKHPQNPKWDVCKICSKECRYSKSHRDLRSHMRVHEEKPKDVNISKDFLCNFCPYATTTQCSLNIHIKLMHKGDDADYINCYFCPYRVKALPALVRHVRTHTGETPYKCPKCPHATRDTGQLRSHMNQIHPADATGRDLKCPKCPTAFRTERDLNIHVKRVHGKNPFKCQMCPDLQPFLSSSILRQHKRKMHPKGGLHYVCPHCPKKFRLKDQLQLHVYSHTGERPFKCDKCSYATARPGNLAKHKKLCKGKERKDEIEVECDECGQKFTNEGNVKRHKSKWHPKKKKSLKCQHQLCNENFADSDGLQNHLENMHGNGNGSQTADTAETNKQQFKNDPDMFSSSDTQDNPSIFL